MVFIDMAITISYYVYMNKKLNGFTIVELLVVIVIIGILASISIVAYNGIQNKARASATDADLANIEKKLNIYYTQNGTVPTSLEMMEQDGFGDMTDKMTWHDGGWYRDYDISRGEYLVEGFDESDRRNGAGFHVIYWDYTRSLWAGKTWWWDQYGKLRIEDYDPMGGCTTEKLSQCPEPVYN